MTTASQVTQASDGSAPLVLFLRDGTLVAQKFDMKALTLTGDARHRHGAGRQRRNAGNRSLLGLEHRDFRVSIDQREQPPADVVQSAGRGRRPARRAGPVRHDESVARWKQGGRRSERSAAAAELRFVDRRFDQRRQHDGSRSIQAPTVSRCGHLMAATSRGSRLATTSRTSTARPLMDRAWTRRWAHQPMPPT